MLRGRKSWVDKYVGDWLTGTPSPPQLSLHVSPASPQTKTLKRKRNTYSCGVQQMPLSCLEMENHDVGDVKGLQVWKPGHLTQENDDDATGSQPSSPSLEETDISPPFSPKSSRNPSQIMELDNHTRSSVLSLASTPTFNSKTSLKNKLEALEFNCTPVFAFHNTPSHEKCPQSVSDLLTNLSISASGCGCIPVSLKCTLESHPKLATEALSPFLWASQQLNHLELPPSPTDLKLWELVQEIVQHTAKLSRQNSEESEYYPLVQKILDSPNNKREV